MTQKMGNCQFLLLVYLSHSLDRYCYVCVHLSYVTKWCGVATTWRSFLADRFVFTCFGVLLLFPLIRSVWRRLCVVYVWALWEWFCLSACSALCTMHTLFVRYTYSITPRVTNMNKWSQNLHNNFTKEWEIKTEQVFWASRWWWW